MSKDRDLHFQKPVGGNSMPKMGTTCIHEIFAEWCHECKYTGTTSVKQLLMERNIEIVRNFLKWPTRVNRTT